MTQGENRDKQYISWALFLKLQTAEINFEKRLGWLKEQF